jgi:hypothetical protein
MASIRAEKLAELVFNLDELGGSDWEDGKPRKQCHHGQLDRMMYFIQSHDDIET